MDVLLGLQELQIFGAVIRVIGGLFGNALGFRLSLAPTKTGAAPTAI